MRFNWENSKSCVPHGFLMELAAYSSVQSNLGNFSQETELPLSSHLLSFQVRCSKRYVGFQGLDLAE